MAQSLEEVRRAIDAGMLSVPLHRHLGISLERTPSGGSRVLMPPTPQIIDPGGNHSPGAVYVLADVAAGLRLCDEIAPRALEMEMGALFLTVSAQFKPAAAASGTLVATAEVTKGFEEPPSGRQLKKATLEVTASVSGENGEPAGEQRVRFYVRFMETSRIRELAPDSSPLIQVLGT